MRKITRKKNVRPKTPDFLNKRSKSNATQNMANVNYLPVEILIQIFSNLSVKEMQKVCTVVCKHWKNVIRNDFKLSSELSLAFAKFLLGSRSAREK